MNATQSSPGPLEYRQAFRSVQRVKNILILLLLLAILVHVAAFVLVAFVGVLDGLHEGDADAHAGAADWEYYLGHVLPIAKNLAPIIAMVLALWILLGLKMSLIGRLGGAAGLVGAFFWALVLLALVTPWQNIFVTGGAVCGALFDLGELGAATAKVRPQWNPGKSGALWHAHVLYFARFLGYLGVTLLVWIVTQIKFARACKRMRIPPDVAIRSAHLPAQMPRGETPQD